jgi:hypothetical protein
VGALLLIVSYRVYVEHGTDNPEELPNLDEVPATSSNGVPNVFDELAQAHAEAPHEPAGAIMRFKEAHC